jgi:hypothetical protein
VRYSAQNEIGIGPASPVAYILAADVPDTVQASQLSAEIVDSSLRLTWTLPQNGGSEILEGQIVLRHADGISFTEESTHCQLAEDSTPFDSRSCLIPLSALRLDVPASNVYQLPQGGTIAFKIKFRNEVGWGTFSVEFPTDGSLVMEIAPHTPPSGPSRVHSLTLGTQMGISIAELTGTSTGGSPILSYHVEVDQAGGGTGPWTEVAGFTTDSMQT